MRAIPVSIFEDKRLGNSSNHGISERYNEILLLHPDGFIEVDMENPPENLCTVMQREVMGRVDVYVRPIKEPEGIGWMYGGTLVYSSDSRFGHNPLRLHDRQETQEQYDMLSR